MGREYFLRNAILIIDHGKDAMVSLIELDLNNKTVSFEQLINANQHEIYHLCISSKCCQCGPGYKIPKKQFLFQSQLELLFDKSTKLTCHKTSSSNTFCCSTAKAGISTDVLDLTLARFFLMNFCLDVFWYSCLTFHGRTLENFLNNNKHDLYHLWQHNTSCCFCTPSYAFPANRLIINQKQWSQMFNAVSVPCANHRKRPHSGSTNCICTMSAFSGIIENQLDKTLAQIILQHCCSVWKAMETLVQIRNHAYGHAKEGKMSETDYKKSVSEIENAIIIIARTCNKEPQFKQKVHEAMHGPLDETLWGQYQTSLMNFISKQNEFEQNVRELKGKIASKAVKMPRLMHDTVHQKELTVEKRHTYYAISRHWKSRTFVETYAVKKCIEECDNYNVFIITGRTGSGKSRIGLEILRQFGEMFDEMDLVKLTDLTKVKEVITGDKSLALLLDGVFSKTICPCNQEQTKDILEILHDHRDEIKLKIIFTCLPDVRHAIDSLFQKHQLFHDFYEINLNNNKFRISDHEKEQLFLKYLKREKYEIVDSTDKENINDKCILDRKQAVSICKSTISNIIKADHLIGFPHLCTMFTSNRVFTHLGVTMFCHPTEIVLKQINELRDCCESNKQAKLWYTTLCYILLNDNSLAKVGFEDDKVGYIATKCGFRVRDLLEHRIMASAKQMVGTYLLYNEEIDCFQFANAVVYEVVVLSFYEVDPKLVISIITFDVINNLVRLEGYANKEQEVTLLVSKSFYGNLIERLVYIFKQGYVTNSFNFVKVLSQAMLFNQNDAYFLELLMLKFSPQITNDRKQIHYLNKNESMPFYFPSCLLFYISRRQKVEHSIATILNQMKPLGSAACAEITNSCKISILASLSFLCKNGNPGGKLELLWGAIDDLKIPCDVNTCLQITMENNNVTVAGWIIWHLSAYLDIIELILETEYFEQLVDLFAEDLKIKAHKNNDKQEIIKWLLSNSPKNKFDTSKIVTTTCRRGMHELLNWLLLNFSNTFSSCDINIIVKEVCKQGLYDVMITLLTKGCRKQSHMYLILKTACFNQWESIYSWLLSNIEYTPLEIETVVSECVEHAKFRIIKDILLHHTNYKTQNVNMVIPRVFARLDFWPFMICLLKELEIGVAESHKSNCGLYHTNLHVADSIYTNKEVSNDFQNNGTLNEASNIYISSGNTTRTSSDILSIAENKSRSVDISIGITYSNVSWKAGGVSKTVGLSRNKRSDTNNKNVIEYTANGGLVFECIKIVKFILEHLSNDKTLAFISIFNIVKYFEYRKEITKLFVDFIFTETTDIFFLTESLCMQGNIEIIQCLLQYVNYEKFDIIRMAQSAFETGNLKIVKFLFSEESSPITNITEVMATFPSNHLHDRNISDLIVWMIENIDQSRYELGMILPFETKNNESVLKIIQLAAAKDRTLIKRTFTSACKYSNLELVKLILGNVDNELLDFDSAIDSLLQSSEEGELDKDLFLYILQHVGHTLIDMRIMTKVMNRACECYDLKPLEWIVNNVDHKLLDFDYAIDNLLKKLICRSNPFTYLERERYKNVFLYLLQHVDHTLIDMKKVKNEVFRWSWSLYGQTLVKWTVQNVDQKVPDFISAIDYLFLLSEKDELDEDSSEEDEIDEHFLLLLLPHVNHTLIDIQKVLNAACKHYCQELVKWIVDNIDHKLLNFISAIDIFLVQSEKDELDQDFSENILLLLLQDVNHTLVDMKKIMNKACKFPRHCETLVKWIVENVDHKLLDFNSAIDSLCLLSDEDEIAEDLILILLPHVKHTLIDIQKVLNAACKHYCQILVKWIVENVDHKLLDFNSAIDTLFLLNDLVYRKSVDRLILYILTKSTTAINVSTIMDRASHVGYPSVVLWLLQNCDNKLFDLKLVMNEVSYHGDVEIVEWLWNNTSHHQYDLRTAMIKTCRGCNSLELVVWLWNNTEQQAFDMETAMNNASRHCNDMVIEWMIENLPNNLYDMLKALSNACEHGSLKIVELLMLQVDKTLLDVQNALETACRNVNHGLPIAERFLSVAADERLDINRIIDVACKCHRTDIIRVLIEKQNKSTLDFRTILNLVLRMKARIEISNDQQKDVDERKKKSLVVWILEQTNPSLIDSERLLTEVCTKGWVDVLMLIWEEIDHTLLNVEAAVDIACQHGRQEIVKWALHNVEKNHLNLSVLMNESCGYGWTEEVKWLLHNNNHGQFDMRTSMNDACEYKRCEVVEWLITNINMNQFDINNVLIQSCENGWLNVVTELFQRVNEELFQLKKIASAAACINGHIKIVEFLFSKFGYDAFDLQELETQGYSRSKEVIDFLCQHYSRHKDFNLSVILTNASGHGWTDTIEHILLQKQERDFDWTAALTNACTNGETGAVEILINEIGHTEFDMKTAMIFVCRYGWEEIATILLEHVDHSLLGINEAIQEACGSGEQQIVELILDKCRRSLLSIKMAVDIACNNHLNEDLVLWILERCGNSDLDVKELKSKAFKHGWHTVIDSIQRLQ